MNKGMRARLWIGVMLVTSVLPGCRQPTVDNKTQYILDPRRGAELGTASTQGALEVRRFTTDLAFAGKNFVYRTGESKYETDFYHAFLVSPAAMMREATRDWLAQSGLFARVVDGGAYGEPAYALEANIKALYGDTRDENAPKAVLELRVFLLKAGGSRDPVVLHSQVYSASRDAAAADADGLVAGFNACLQAILADLEKDLAAKLR